MPRLLIGTRKGAWSLTSDSSRSNWQVEGPWFLGNIVNHLVCDPREPSTLLMAARTGHLGPTIFRSTDAGASWQEASQPPAFSQPVPRQATADNVNRAGSRRGNEPLANFDPEANHISPRSVGHTFWLAPAHASEPGCWYAGTSPQGLFRSEDNGNSWQPVDGFNNHRDWPLWTEDGQDETPDGAILHSIIVDPRDASHLYVGLSGGGVFESLDQGANWHPLNEGLFVDFGPDPYPEYGQDPHCMRLHPANPDVLYQQNHCGIYRLDRPATKWQRIGDNMPRDIGDIGFPIVLHPRDENRAWVFPMDATDVWPRTCPGGMPAVYQTKDGGNSWSRHAMGLPKEQAWLTVLRQAMTIDSEATPGIYFGTTTGELWASFDEGESWQCILRHLPHIYSVEAA